MINASVVRMVKRGKIGHASLLAPRWRQPTRWGGRRTSMTSPPCVFSLLLHLLHSHSTPVASDACPTCSQPQKPPQGTAPLADALNYLSWVIGVVGSRAMTGWVGSRVCLPNRDIRSLSLTPLQWPLRRSPLALQPPRKLHLFSLPLFQLPNTLSALGAAHLPPHPRLNTGTAAPSSWRRRGGAIDR